MKSYLGALLVVAPLFAGAGSFPYLTPSDLQGRTLYEGALDQWNFEREAPGITTYASAAPLPSALRDSLRAMGAEVFACVAFDPDDAPDYFRLRAGFKAALSLECDGVYLPDGDRLPPACRQALDAAKEDAAMAVRLRDLVRRLYDGQDLLARDEGRRAVRWILDAQGCRDLSADTLRLEVGAWIYRLESVLGLEHAPAPKETGSFGTLPRHDIPRGLPSVEMSMNTKKPVRLDADGRVTVQYGSGRFAIQVRDPVGECRLELTMAAGTRNLFYGYRVAAPQPSHAPKNLPPRAPFPARGLMNGVEPRFPMPRVHGAVFHETCSASYPDPHLAWSKETARDKSSVTYCFKGSCLDFGALAPMAEAGRVDSWRVVVKTEAGTLCDVRLAWPTGSAAYARKYLSELAGKDLAATWDRVINGVMDKRGGFAPPGLRHRYAMSSYEGGFAFLETKDRCFQIGDPKSDALFWSAYAKEFWGKHPTPERLATVRQDIADARREYLKACYAGGPFKQPIADRAKSTAARLPTTDSDLGETDEMSLDED